MFHGLLQVIWRFDGNTRHFEFIYLWSLRPQAMITKISNNDHTSNYNHPDLKLLSLQPQTIITTISNHDDPNLKLKSQWFQTVIPSLDSHGLPASTSVKARRRADCQRTFLKVFLILALTELRSEEVDLRCTSVTNDSFTRPLLWAKAMLSESDWTDFLIVSDHFHSFMKDNLLTGKSKAAGRKKAQWISIELGWRRNPW